MTDIQGGLVGSLMIEHLNRGEQSREQQSTLNQQIRIKLIRIFHVYRSINFWQSRTPQLFPMNIRSLLIQIVNCLISLFLLIKPHCVASHIPILSYSLLVDTPNSCWSIPQYTTYQNYHHLSRSVRSQYIWSLSLCWSQDLDEDLIWASGVGQKCWATCRDGTWVCMKLGPLAPIYDYAKREIWWLTIKSDQIRGVPFFSDPEDHPSWLWVISLYSSKHSNVNRIVVERRHDPWVSMRACWSVSAHI